MSLYQKASLVQIPSGYKAADAKLYSVVPNTTAGDFTVSSDADATRVNKDGLVETTAANQARLNYDFIDGVIQPDPRLLLEPTRTNSLPESENFSTNWVKVDTSVSGNIYSPDGGTNAYSLIEGTATGGKIIFDTISVSAGSVTYSLFIKKGDKRYTALLLSGVVTTSMFNVDLENGTGTTATGSFDSTSIEEYPNGWYRISVTATATTGNLNCNVYLMNGATYNDRNYTGNGTDKTYIFGAQLEAGSYPTSYIPTSGSAVTRTEDFCYINSGLQDILNTSEGTLFVDVEVPRVSTTGSFERITLSDQNASTDRILFDNYGGNWRALMLSTAGNVNKTIVNVTANQRIKVAIAYSSTELRISYDGNTATTTSGSYTPTTTLESFKFSNKDGGSKWQGKIHQAIYFNTALTNAELITLTS